MSKKSLALKKGNLLFEHVILNRDRLPFSFVCGGQKYQKALNAEEKTQETNQEIVKELSYCIDNTLKITYHAKLNKEFGQIEYYALIQNTGTSLSQPITDFISADLSFEGNEPLVRGNYGDLGKYYEAYESRLNHGDVRFKQDDGRACHICFPYFDLCYGSGGVLLALGWAGTWETLFTTSQGITKVISRTCLNMNVCLLPGEQIRSALVVLLPYRGRNEANATNLWREWFVKYNMPKGILPFSTCMLANDTGVPNHDGSVSETYLTYRPSLEKLQQEDLLTDYRWIDAGWYEKPTKETSNDDWWNSVGSYEADHVKWPDQSMKEASEYCHSLHMGTFLWFEPERVSHLDALIQNYGYHKEWAYETPDAFYNNIGNEECFHWTVSRILRALDDYGIDMYREDNNQTPVYAWKAMDAAEGQELHIPRSGINENKCVLAHYKLLDTILDYQKNHNKSNFVDLCAGGGGRNDIESLRRGIPIMRSDIDRGTSSMRLSQSSTLCKWIVFHGSSTKESDCTYRLLGTSGASSYVARASYLPVFNLNEAFVHNPNLDYHQIRRNFCEWRSINHLLTKDFYLLTPYRHNTNKTAWCVFAYDDGMESILLGFRMEECLENTCTVKLPYVKKGRKYEILDVDRKEKVILEGKELLSRGITLRLDQPKTSILLRIK